MLQDIDDWAERLISCGPLVFTNSTLGPNDYSLFLISSLSPKTSRACFSSSMDDDAYGDSQRRLPAVMSLIEQILRQGSSIHHCISSLKNLKSAPQSRESSTDVSIAVSLTPTLAHHEKRSRLPLSSRAVGDTNFTKKKIFFFFSVSAPWFTLSFYPIISLSLSCFASVLLSVTSQSFLINVQFLRRTLLPSSAVDKDDHCLPSANYSCLRHLPCRLNPMIDWASLNTWGTRLPSACSPLLFKTFTHKSYVTCQ